MWKLVSMFAAAMMVPYVLLGTMAVWVMVEDPVHVFTVLIIGLVLTSINLITAAKI